MSDVYLKGSGIAGIARDRRKRNSKDWGRSDSGFDFVILNEVRNLLCSPERQQIPRAKSSARNDKLMVIPCNSGDCARSRCDPAALPAISVRMASFAGVNP
jgi:hypothetical protein